MSTNLLTVARILNALADDLRNGDSDDRAVSAALQATRAAILSERTQDLGAHLRPWMAATQVALERETDTEPDSAHA